MLFAVRADFSFPDDLAPERFAELKEREVGYAHALQRQGVLRHVRRVAGTTSNLSIFDVTSNDHLHEVLSGVPSFPYLTIQVTPPAQHPSALFEDTPPGR